MSGPDDKTNNTPDDGMTDEEREFAAGFNATDEAPDPGNADEPAAPAEPGQPAAADGSGSGDGEDPAQGVDTPENADEPANQDDWLAALPEEVRNRFKEQESASQRLQQELAQARNDHAAMAGKIAPLQRQLAQLTRDGASPKQTQTAAAPVKPGDGPQTAEELDALLETPEFKEYAATFPEEAKVWRSTMHNTIKVAEQIAERRINESLKRFEGRINPVLDRVERQQHTEDMAGRIATLEAVHPDWKDHSASDEFSSWFMDEYVPSLPDDQQKLYADEAYTLRALSQPKFASRVLTEYKRDKGIVTAGTPANNTEPRPDNGAPSGKKPVSSRLALSADPGVVRAPSTGRVNIDSLNPDQAFLAGLNSPD